MTTPAGGRPKHPRPPCACGCGAPVKAAERRYASQACVRRVGFRAMWTKAADPAWRQARTEKAVAAARAARFAAACARAAGLTPPAAYAAGYRAGYNRAMRWWKRRFARFAAAKKGAAA